MKPRNTEDTSQGVVRRFYTLKGKYPVHGYMVPAAGEKLVRNCSFVVPSPAQETPRPVPGVTWEEDPSYTQIAAHQ